MQQQALDNLVRVFKALIQKKLVLLHKSNNTIIIAQTRVSQDPQANQRKVKQDVWMPRQQVINEINQVIKIEYYKSFTNYIKAVANTHRLKYPHAEKFNLKRVYHRGRAHYQRLFLITIPKEYLQFNTNSQQAGQEINSSIEQNESLQQISEQDEDLTQNQQKRKNSQISLHNNLIEQQQKQKKMSFQAKDNQNKNQNKNNLFKDVVISKNLSQLMEQSNFDQTQENYHKVKSIIAVTIKELLQLYKVNAYNSKEGQQQQKQQEGYVSQQRQQANKEINQSIKEKITLIYDIMGDNIQKIDQILNVSISMNPHRFLNKKQRDIKNQESISSFKQVMEKDIKQDQQPKFNTEDKEVEKSQSK